MTGGASAASLMTAALEVARLASQVALRYFRTDFRLEHKPDGSPVTEADRAAEQAARSWILSRFPDDGIIGEELGEQPGSSRRSWLLDPIDGTRSFVAGVPLWGTLVAVLEGERVLAGAASYPAVSEHLVAAPGEGCWHDGTRCRVSTVGSLGAATVLITDPQLGTPAQRQGWARIAAAAATARYWGDCYGYLLVATGRAEAMLDQVMNPWDSAALQPIILEAGGRFTDWSGEETALGGSVVATNAALAGPLRACL